MISAGNDERAAARDKSEPRWIRLRREFQHQQRIDAGRRTAPRWMISAGNDERAAARNKNKQRWMRLLREFQHQQWIDTDVEPRRAG